MSTSSFPKGSRWAWKNPKAGGGVVTLTVKCEFPKAVRMCGSDGVTYTFFRKERLLTSTTFSRIA